MTAVPYPCIKIYHLFLLPGSADVAIWAQYQAARAEHHFATQGVEKGRFG